MSDNITDDKAQILMDCISNCCEELALSPEATLDGIARTLLSASIAFQTKNLKVNIDKIGTVEVNVIAET